MLNYFWQKAFCPGRNRQVQVLFVKKLASIQFFRKVMVVQNLCIECGHKCSPAAKACPSCGQPNPTSPPKPLTDQIEEKTGLWIVLIAAFVFLVWLFAPRDKFYIVLGVGIVIVLLIMFFGFLAKSIINWEKTIGYILMFPFVIWGMISYHDKNYMYLFFAAVLALPGLIIIFKNSQDR